MSRTKSTRAEARLLTAARTYTGVSGVDLGPRFRANNSGFRAMEFTLLGLRAYSLGLRAYCLGHVPQKVDARGGSIAHGRAHL